MRRHLTNRVDTLQYYRDSRIQCVQKEIRVAEQERKQEFIKVSLKKQVFQFVTLYCENIMML